MATSKRFIKPLRIIIVILAVTFAALIIFSFISRPYDKTSTRYTNVEIEYADDLQAAATKLEDMGIVASASRFMLISRIMSQTEFRPGTYYLSPSMSSPAIARTMVSGLTTTNGFTIPPGYDLEQIASSLARDGFIDEDDFFKAASSSFLQDIEFIGTDISGPEQIEGFLFPDDYTVDANADETMIIMTMLDRFSNNFTDDYRARAEELDMSIREIIIIASMIEQDTVIDKERPEISAVIHNRINLDLYEDGELPEIPLCSPSAASIEAALYPAENDNILYIFSDSLDGSHVFVSDEEEYEMLVEKYNKAFEMRGEG